ncbi:MAG TPA: hypothetical protein P5077_04205 [bacterium]|nr:hypothetical protein [bacterium]
MSNPEQNGGKLPEAEQTDRNYRRKMILSFSIFFVFFVFYIGTAVIQTPQFRELASIPLLGMPLGLFLSLGVFPVSWLLIVLYFRLGR